MIAHCPSDAQAVYANKRHIFCSVISTDVPVLAKCLLGSLGREDHKEAKLAETVTAMKLLKSFSSPSSEDDSFLLGISFVSLGLPLLHPVG